MSKFKRIFKPMPEDQEEDRQRLDNIVQKLKDDKHCRFCVYAEERPRYEMGYDAGADVYCTKINELRLGYATGQQCLFWNLK